MSRNTIASINLAAIKHNLKIVRRLAPDSKIVSVVKADGYGHGIKRVTDAFQGADMLAVATPDEAAALREGGWRGRLLMLEGFANVDAFELAKALNAEMVIHHQSQVEILRQRKWATGNKLWLKLDTGMHRLGFPLRDARQTFSELSSIAGKDGLILMSHFACADEPDNPMTQMQIERFDDATQGIDAEQSLANSAGILNY